MNTNETKHEYEIGGICVTMTAAQAAAWNDGDMTPDTYAGAVAYVTRPVNDSERYPLDAVLRLEELPPELSALEGHGANRVR